MIDHIGFNVRDYAKSKAFYVAALSPLGYSIGMEDEKSAFMLRDGKGGFWFGEYGPYPEARVHIGFSARSREEVVAFHTAALAAGATDNGAPGVREQYGPDYFAAFAIDPDGHNIEAVYRG